MQYSTSDSTSSIIGAVKITKTNVITGEEDIIHVINTFVHAGKASIARRIANAEVGYGKITVCAVGTGAGTPGTGDTVMFNELFRKTISKTTISSNVVTYTTFFSTSEANGVLTELGLFGDAATTEAEDGTMYAHTNIIKTKTTSDTLTIEWTITIV